MPNWTTFAGLTGVVLVLLLVLSYLTQSTFESAEFDTGESESGSGSGSDLTATSRDVGAAPTAGDDDPSAVTTDDPDLDLDLDFESETSHQLEEPAPVERPRDDPRMTTGMVLANVAASQGLFALVLLGAVIYTGIPADALGIEFSRSYLESGILLGTAVGIGLYVANEVGAAVATRFGFDHDEQLRELLAPESPRGWLALLGVVLPIIALFEELLFRAALIGVIAAGFGVSPWLLAIVSSIAFAIGHGMQGGVGVVVTGVLGFVLATIFILTGSFLVVVLAHYLINTLEFVVHERLGFEWAETLES